MVLRERNHGKVIALLLSFLVSLVLCGKLLHPFLYFCVNRSPFPIILLYIAWLLFRLVNSYRADQYGIMRGLLLGFEVFLIIEYLVNTYTLLHFDQEAFTASLYTSMGLFLVIERARKVFPSIGKRLPLPLVTFGMAAFLFFGSLSSLLLLRIPIERFRPGPCKHLSTLCIPGLSSISGSGALTSIEHNTYKLESNRVSVFDPFLSCYRSEGSTRFLTRNRSVKRPPL